MSVPCSGQMGFAFGFTMFRTELGRTVEWNRRPIRHQSAIATQIIRINKFATEFETLVPVGDSLHGAVFGGRKLPWHHRLLVNRTVRTLTKHAAIIQERLQMMSLG